MNSFEDSIRSQLICPISQSMIKQVCRLSCGHIFDVSSFFGVIVSGSNLCPVCRASFTLRDIKSDHVIQGIIDCFKTTRDASTQTGDSDFLIDEPLIIVENTIPPFRLVDLETEPINIASSELDTNDPDLIEMNARFVRSDGRPTPIWKYNYQSTLNLAQVLQRLLDDGYLVYDLFKIATHNGLHRYRLYSTDYRIGYDGTRHPNILSKIKR